MYANRIYLLHIVNQQKWLFTGDLLFAKKKFKYVFTVAKAKHARDKAATSYEQAKLICKNSPLLVSQILIFLTVNQLGKVDTTMSEIAFSNNFVRKLENSIIIDLS